MTWWKLRAVLTPEDYVIYPDPAVKEGKQVTVNADTE